MRGYNGVSGLKGAALRVPPRELWVSLRVHPRFRGSVKGSLKGSSKGSGTGYSGGWG